MSVESGNKVEEHLLKIADLIESLVSEFYALAKIVENGEDAMKSVGFRPRTYPTTSVSNRQSKTIMEYGEGSKVDVQKQNSNCEVLIRKVLNGEIRSGEIAKHL
jgi:hypothetical protein